MNSIKDQNLLPPCYFKHSENLGLQIENLERYPGMPKDLIAQFHQSQVHPSKNSAIIESESTAKKILKIAVPIFFVGGCLLNRKKASFLTAESFYLFLGNRGWTTPTLIISGHLGLKYLTFLNQKPEEGKISAVGKTFNWLKKAPTIFGFGCLKSFECVPYLATSVIVSLIFNSFSTHTSNREIDFTAKQASIGKASVWENAVKVPFVEELFFREVLQGSLVSTMKLINLARFRMGKKAIMTDETINTYSRIFSSTLFAIGHTNNALQAGLISYFCLSKLYEDHGLFASFGAHSAINFSLPYLREIILEMV